MSCHRVNSGNCGNSGGCGEGVGAVWLRAVRAGVGACVLAVASTAQSATFTVDTSADDGSAAFQVCDANPGNCSLRGAIAKADELKAAFKAKIPLGELGRLDDLAGAYVYLASDLARYVVGQSLVIDGGWQVG